MNEFGISIANFQMLLDIFSRFNQIKKVILYGSRAKGTFNSRSDTDLVISGGKIDNSTLTKLISEINESNFPYTIDIQILENIKSNALLEEIKQYGKVVYEC